MEPEAWKAVPGWEGLYEVSDLGRVRSLPRKRCRGRVLKTRAMAKGHLIVRLSGKPHRLESWFVHRLVLTAFVGPRPEGLITRHRDGNPENNRLGNLLWGTHKENHEDAKAHGTFERGEKRSKAKITDEQCLEIRRQAEAGESIPALALKYGIAYRTAHHIITGVKWAHIGGPIKSTRARWYLAPEQVLQIRDLVASGKSLSSVGRQFGVPANTIKCIRDRRSYNWV